eukprot:11558656-Prorocentrum_lima.AAC.1
MVCIHIVSRPLHFCAAPTRSDTDALEAASGAARRDCLDEWQRNGRQADLQVDYSLEAFQAGSS